MSAFFRCLPTDVALCCSANSKRATTVGGHRKNADFGLGHRNERAVQSRTPTRPNMKRHATVFASIALIGCAATQAPSPESGTSPAITESDLRRRLYLIADDSMMGRESGSQGDYKTAEYVAANSSGSASSPRARTAPIFRPFRSGAPPSTRSRIVDVDGTTLELGRDFLPATVRAPARTLDGVASHLRRRRPTARSGSRPAQAAGQVVMLDVPAGTSLRGASSHPRAGAARRPSLSSYSTCRAPKRSRDSARAAGRRHDAHRPRSRAVGHAARRDGDLRRGSVDARAGRRRARRCADTSTSRARRSRTRRATSSRFCAAAIPRCAASTWRSRRTTITSGSTTCPWTTIRCARSIASCAPWAPTRRPRRRPPREWAKIRVILDSLRRVNRPRLDSIRNGADDDGSGTVAILEIAGAMARGGARPRRSILFVSHTGEEAGLLGSHWYTRSRHRADRLHRRRDRPGHGGPRDVDRLSARWRRAPAAPTYLEVVGAKRLSREFGDSLEAANSREPVPFVFDYTYDAPGHPLQYYCRADHYNYARYGIPGGRVLARRASRLPPGDGRSAVHQLSGPRACFAHGVSRGDGDCRNAESAEAGCTEGCQSACAVSSIGKATPDL